MIRTPFALLLLAPLLLAQPALAAGPVPPTVTVVPAARGQIAERLVLTGTLVARDEVLVSPQVEGLAVVEILAEEGDAVEQGQVLARLSAETVETALMQNAAQTLRADAAAAQARATVTETQATRAQADLALARTRDLLAGGNAAREQFEIREAAARVAAARAEASGNALLAAEADRAFADAQRRELEVRLARTELRAPVAGVVSRRTARLGAVVAGAGEPLFRIIADGAVELEADVPETQLARLRPGQPATLEGAGPARAPGSGGVEPRNGQVRLVSPEVSRTSRLGRVRVALEGGTSGLPVGGFARAVVETARREGVLTPLSSVLFGADGPVVQVVEDGVVRTRQVAVGLRTAREAEITAGLAEGESVVAVSGTFIRGGDRVRPVAATPREGAAPSRGSPVAAVVK